MSDLLLRTLPRALWHASAWRELHVVEDLPYAERPGCRLDVLRPAGATGPLPVVVHIHGGGFRVLSKETHGYPTSRYARAGFVVLNVEYRLAPDHPFPAAVQDAHDAWLWAVDSVQALGGDPDRMVISGESAGGNLALGLALSTALERPEPWARAVRERAVRPAAVHVVYGFLQASDRPTPQDPGLVERIAASRLDVIAHDYLARADRSHGLAYANPIELVEALTPAERAALPPILSVGGTRDPIPSDSRRLARALRGPGLEEAWIYGAGHGFHALPGRRSSQAWEVLLEHAQRLTAAP